MQDVLDAMFEKTVESGDYVIRQGDDGDNFYVIDRYGSPIHTRASSRNGSHLHPRLDESDEQAGNREREILY